MNGKSITLDGNEWFLTVTRNMPFWHQVLSSEGLYNNFKDWGIDSNLESLSLTLNSTLTHWFTIKDNYSEHASRLMRYIKKEKAIERLKADYLKYAEELFYSLNKCKLDLNVQNWNIFLDRYRRFCVGLNITTLLGVKGGEELSNLLKLKKYKDSELPNIISIITYPKESTPLLNSQKEMLKIAIKLKSGELTETQIENLLNKWLLEYQHIPVNFCDEPWTMNNAKEQLNSLIQMDCKKELDIIEKAHTERIENAEKMLKEINNKEITILANAIAEGTYLNEFRKNVFSRVALEYRTIFTKLAGIIGSSNWRDILYLKPEETMKILEGNKIDINKIKEERAVTVQYIDSRGKMIYLSKEQAKVFEKQANELIMGRKQDEVKKETIIKGFSASRGIVKGKVKVILSSKDFNKMQTGDILVTTMTSVDFVPIMQKAAAFVTNEGGITSHASIVARELNKPCIIGTKIATKLLKDNMLVEVDANKGIVKIIK